jgi:hypothetical protein
MRINIRVEASDCPRGAHPPDQVLAFEKLQGAIDSGLRQTRQLLSQPAVNRFCRGMGKVLSQRAIHRQTLRRNSDAAQATELLELRAPAIYFAALAARHLVATNYHLRIIII